MCKYSYDLICRSALSAFLENESDKDDNLILSRWSTLVKCLSFVGEFSFEILTSKA